MIISIDECIGIYDPVDITVREMSGPIIVALPLASGPTKAGYENNARVRALALDTVTRDEKESADLSWWTNFSKKNYTRKNTPICGRGWRAARSIK